MVTRRDRILCRLSREPWSLVETAFLAVSHCISYHFIIKKAAVRRSMRRCLIAQSRSMSKTPRPPSCAYPSSGLIAVRPPYKNTLRSQKSVPLHSTLKKCYAARSIMYIRPMVISFLKAWRSQLTFGFEKGRQAGSLSPPITDPIGAPDATCCGGESGGLGRPSI